MLLFEFVINSIYFTLYYLNFTKRCTTAFLSKHVLLYKRINTAEKYCIVLQD